MRNDFYVSEYGARADGKTLNTQSIQKAIDACHNAGGGRVICGPGCFITGAIQIKTNVELHVPAGCRLQGSADLGDYEALSAPGFIAPGPENSSQSLIRAVEAENIAITGAGEINGTGQAFYDTASLDSAGKFNKPPNPKPRIVMFYRCHNVRLQDVSLVDSACWTVWLMQCRDVNVQRVKIRADRRMRTVDGIDIDACRNVTVSDSFFDTEDDCIAVRAMRGNYDTPAICENITVNNCVLESKCNGIRVGCPGDGVIRNCAFSNLIINNDSANGIIFAYPQCYIPKDGLTTADVHDIVFSNVTVNCARWPVKILVSAGVKLVRLSDLSFSNFRVKSGEPCLVQGCAETIVRNITFNNFEMETDGEDAIICRYCRHVKYVNVDLSNRSEQ